MIWIEITMWTKGKYGDNERIGKKGYIGKLYYIIVKGHTFTKPFNMIEGEKISGDKIDGILVKRLSTHAALPKIDTDGFAGYHLSSQKTF